METIKTKEKLNIICFEVDTLEERAEAILLSLSYALSNESYKDYDNSILTGMNGYIFDICRAYLPKNRDDRFKIWELMETHPTFDIVNKELEKQSDMTLSSNVYLLHIYHYFE